jgi:hypothetical protein
MEQRVLEKLTVAQLVKKLSAFYVIRSFITVFTRAHQVRGPVQHFITGWIFTVRVDHSMSAIGHLFDMPTDTLHIWRPYHLSESS